MKTQKLSLADSGSNFRACLVVLCSAVLALMGCSAIPSSGPGRIEIERSAGAPDREGESIAIVDVSSDFAQRLRNAMQPGRFSTTFGADSRENAVVGRGDALDVTLWEAPPAVLFGNGVGAPAAGSVASPAMVTLPPQVVNDNGTIVVPYAGNVLAAGRSTDEIQTEIVRRLQGKANQPQALVRVGANASSTVTVVGEVKTDTRVPLTPAGEKLLDALAHAGGPTQPVSKTTIQLTRQGTSQSMPLASVIADPAQNVPLRAGDVVTVVSQSLSFTALGASGKNDEINFEATGISLAQALARMGGIQDNRADASGVFIFRYEDPALFNAKAIQSDLTQDGRLPVVYRVNLRNPASFFAVQRFPVKDKDIIYVANAPATELQKFLNIILSGVYPIAYILNGNL